MNFLEISYVMILVLGVVASVVIIEQKLIDKSLRDRIKFENLITTISTNFMHLSTEEIDEGISYALKKFGEFADVDRIFIYIFHNHEKKIVKINEWCNERTYPKINKIENLKFESLPVWLEELKNSKTIYIPDISKIKSNGTTEKEILKSYGIKSIAAIPMIYGGSPKGFLGLESIRIKRKWKKDDLALLKLTGEILASEIERKKSKEKIQYLMLKDKLTGLYNRTYFEEELKRLDTKRQLPLSFIIIDINGLKLVNDTFGRKEGDKLLKRVTKILKRCCREEDIIARWGEDEFSILLPETTGKSSEEIINRIRSTCDKTNDQKIPLSVSLGTSTKIDEHCNIRTTVKEAEDRMYRRKLLERNSISSSIISSLERMLQEKSFETEEHAVRMKELALVMGRSLKLPENKLNELSLLSTLHDIGKIAIPDKILLKPGKLTKKEWAIVKKHPEVGYNISGSSPHLDTIANAVLSHHERWDGSGYPLGLKGENIPLVSRIISIVDSYDVMTHDRSYKKAISKKDALKELERCAGTQFDPGLVKVFIQISS
mgnify:CR=1 FL=1